MYALVSTAAAGPASGAAHLPHDAPGPAPQPPTIPGTEPAPPEIEEPQTPIHNPGPIQDPGLPAPISAGAAFGH